MRSAVLGLHWQVNVIEPEGFFGGMLAEPVASSGVVGRAARFHQAAREAGAELVLTRFTVPPGEGGLVRNTAFMRAVGDAQAAFRPDAPGSALIAEMSDSDGRVVDNAVPGGSGTRISWAAVAAQKAHGRSDQRGSSRAATAPGRPW
ncbi:isochorismatase family protein [Saccharopolyspora spinosa]|uniref:Isochorismatase family protein n=1 Tax=Saccharopolyspora spinosa TaxID=60894 RepID=A0A2N3XUC6_SACSN|nr:isochorismatase family protein [Saccharopolyspora spinosa]PKW14200.1 isochorismatase family protein [Saccharopolyspora spinosa]